MLKFVILAVAVAVASANLDSRWAVFKTKYNRTYSGDENVIRRYIWEQNLKKIEEHNEKYASGESSYFLGENKYADMTNEEFKRVMNGLRMTKPVELSNKIVDTTFLPPTVDWRKKGYVTPIKDQGQCGSCWAFSAVGSLEGAHKKSTGTLVSLSESNLVDCSGKWGNMGCSGGLMDQAFQYVIDNKGIDTEAGYPYKPEDRPCHFQTSDIGSTEKIYTDVAQGSETALQKAVAEIGPISVAIDASHGSFQLYSGGVYDEPNCSSTQLDHGVLAIGYGVDGGKDFWLVKNSWGTSWGMQGYIEMSRNKNNQCGIATMASYPTV